MRVSQKCDFCETSLLFYALTIRGGSAQTRRSPPPRMAVVIAEAIFWLCQNSQSTNVQGCTLVDERAILAAENKPSDNIKAEGRYDHCAYRIQNHERMKN